MPGTVSLSEGRSGKPGKRLPEVTARRRTLHHGVGGGNRAHHDLVDAACDVLRQLRGGAVGHFDQPEAGAPIEQLGAERGGAGGVVEGDRQLAGIRFGGGDQLAHRGNRQVGVHRQHLRTEAAHQRHRREVARGVVGELLERNRVDRHARGVGEQERVAVGQRARDRLVRQDAGGARHVLDHHRLAERARRAVGHQAGHHVGRGAGPGRHDQLDRAARPGLGVCGRGEHDDSAAQQRTRKNLHRIHLVS
jgi:hypothetical protein